MFTQGLISWGGVVGLTWMIAYWATLLPMWMHVIVTNAGALGR